MSTHEAGGVRIVDHDEGVVLLGEVADRAEPGDVAVHAEDAVGGDHADPGALRRLQRLLEVGHVGVGVAMAVGLAEADAVDDRGVVQGVADDRALLVEERLEEPRVGVEARGVEDRVVHPEEAGDALLELLVDVLRAADEAHRRHAEAVVVEALLRRRDQLGVIAEAEVVVGAEVQHLALLHLDPGALRAEDHSLVLVEARLPDLAEGLRQRLLHRAEHGCLRWGQDELCRIPARRRARGPRLRSAGNPAAGTSILRLVSPRLALRSTSRSDLRSTSGPGTGRRDPERLILTPSGRPSATSRRRTSPSPG